MQIFPVASKEKTNNQVVEEMLTSILSAPDLGQEIVSFIQPFILKAHTLIKSTDLLDAESRRQMENILYRDLPNLVSDYTELSLTYRQEKHLRDDKTHYANFLDNVQFFAGKITDLEEQNFSAQDMKAQASKTIRENKYGKSQNQPEIQSSFQWEKLKATLPTQSIDEMFAKTPVLELDEKIKLVDGEIEYKARKPFKAFMKGTYQSALNLVKSTGYNIEDGYDFVVKTLKHNEIAIHKIVFVSLMLGGVGAATNHYYNSVRGAQSWQIEMLMKADNVLGTQDQAYELNYLTRATNKNSNSYVPGAVISMKDHQAHIVINNVSDINCSDSYDKLNNTPLISGKYSINNHVVAQEVFNTDAREQTQELCNLNNNQIQFDVDLRTYPEKSAQPENVVEDSLMKSDLKQTAHKSHKM